MSKNTSQLKLVNTDLIDTDEREPALDDLSKKISAYHEEIVKSLLSTLHQALRVGQLLIILKEKLKHGEFTPYVTKNLPFSDRTARNYMRLFHKRKELKTANVSDLSSAYKIIKMFLISPPGLPNDEEEKRRFITLSLDNDQNETIVMAIDRAKELLETTSNARAFEHISLDWLEFSSDSELMPIETAKRMFENIYNVKITIHQKRN